MPQSGFVTESLLNIADLCGEGANGGRSDCDRAMLISHERVQLDVPGVSSFVIRQCWLDILSDESTQLETTNVQIDSQS